MGNRIITIVFTLLVLAAIACNAPGRDDTMTSETPAGEAATAVGAGQTPAATQPGAPTTGGSTVQPTAVPTAVPTAAGAGEPQRIRFEAGATSARMQGTATQAIIPSYVLYALESQTMTVSVTASGGTVALTIVAPDGTPLVRSALGQTSWTDVLPASGDYTISVALLEGGPATYTLEVTIPPPDPAAVQCSVTPTTTIPAYVESSRNSEVWSDAAGTGLALARTRNGWIGFDPGVAQAGNVGRTRLRWYNASPTALTFDPAGCENFLPYVLALDTLENATYTVMDGNETIKLTEGRYADPSLSPSQVGTAVFEAFLGDVRAFGDMNGDGSEDAVVVLTTNTGGTGRFIQIIVMLNANGQPQQAGSIFVGDRNPVIAMTVENGMVTAAVSVRAVNGPPVEEIWRLRLEDGALVKIE